MAESTQELVSKFSSNPRNISNGPADAPRYLAPPFGDDHVIGLDPLNDPLDDTGEFTNRVPLAELSRNNTGPASFPPTPRDSPLKSTMHRLRGSPVKTPRRQFQAPKYAPANNPVLGREANLAAESPLLVADFDTDFDPKAAFARDFNSDTKKLGGYHALLSSSTEKLTRELHDERAKVAQLQREVDNLRRENADSARLQSELCDLQRAYASLRARNLSLEVQMSNLQKGDKSPQLARENALLREKLLKYKRLYDESTALKQPSEKAQRDTAVEEKESEEEIPEVSRDTRSKPETVTHPNTADMLKEFEEWRAWKRVSASERQRPTEDVNTSVGENTAAENQLSENTSQPLNSAKATDTDTIQALLKQVLDAVSARNGPPSQGHTISETRSHDFEIGKSSNPRENRKEGETPLRAVSAPSSTSVSPNAHDHYMQEHHKLNPTQPSDCREQLARLEQTLVEMEAKLQNQQIGMQERQPLEMAPQNLHSQRPDMSTNDRTHHNPSGKNLPSSDSGAKSRACKCDAAKSSFLLSSPVIKTCPACASIHLPSTHGNVFLSSFSGPNQGPRVSPQTRPHSESTTKNSAGDHDDTHALMGKYMWNRTV